MASEVPSFPRRRQGSSPAMLGLARLRVSDPYERTNRCPCGAVIAPTALMCAPCRAAQLPSGNRERVRALLVQGYDRDQIAGMLGLARRTVDRHARRAPEQRVR